MGDLDLSLDGALSLAGDVFNWLIESAALAIAFGLAMIVVSIVVNYVRYRKFFN